MTTVAVGVTAGAVQPANAATDLNCTGYGTNALVDSTAPGYSAAYIKNRATGAVVGSVQLCHRKTGNVWQRWTAVILYQDIHTGQRANGRITSRDAFTGYSFSSLCSDAVGVPGGGTGVIVGGTGDRTCASMGHTASRDYSESADAYIYDANGVMIAYGATERYAYNY